MPSRIPLKCLAVFLLFFSTTIHAQTVSSLQSNNTTAYSQFTDVYYPPHISPCPPTDGSQPTAINGDAPASNVSKVSTRVLLYDPSIMSAPPATKLLVELQSWFKTNTTPGSSINPCSSNTSLIGQTNGHADIGYTSTTQIGAQIAELKVRGYDGALYDWNGPASSFDVTMGSNLRTQSEQQGGFVFGIIIDKNAFTNDGSDPNSTQCRSDANASSTAVSTACTQRAITLINYVTSNYIASPAYIKSSDNRPLIGFFVDSGTKPSRSNIDWSQVHAGISGNPILLGDKVGAFSSYDGAYGWIETGDTASADVWGINPFYNAASSNPGKYVIGATFKGFNDSLAAWGLNRKTPQHCGQTWLDAWNANRQYLATHQVPYIQAVTWDDYEEGTELESGIDNCLSSLNLSISGSTLSWNPSFGADPIDGTPGTENTVHHYTVYAAPSGGTTLQVVQDNIAPGTRSYNLSGGGLGPGNWDIYLQAVGQPSIYNHLAGPQPYSAGPNCSVSITSPTNGSTVTSPVQVTASATPIAGASVTSMEIDVDSSSVYSASNTSSVNQSVYVASGNHTIAVKATDSGGGSCQSSVAVLLQAPNYQSDFNAVSQWFNGAILSDGAIRQDGADPNWIKPYFANIGALGLMTDSTRYANVQNWINWYVNHLESPDKWGINGTIWDYSTSGTAETKSTANPDSTDAYAGTFLSVANAYYQSGGSTALTFLQSHQSQIQEVADVLLNANQVDSTDHLTWDLPLPTGNVKYLMDNAEVYRGLKDAANLFQNAFNDPTNASRYSTAADQLRTTMQSQMINTADNSYYTEKDSGGGFGTVAWNAWYATADQSHIGAVSELWPIIFGVISPTDPFAQQIWNRFNSNWSCWPQRCYQTSGADSFPWASVAYAATLMGDKGRADAYVRGIENDYISHNFAGTFGGWYCHEAGWFMRTLSSLMGTPPPPPPPPSGVTVTVSSPSPGATVTSPVTINASASSSSTITGWHIYVDGIDSYSATNVSSISASISMSAASHTIVVRAWDSTGAFGDKTFTLNVVNTGVTVTVSAPTNGATVTSPVTINASASSAHTITGWHIYVDGIDTFVQNNVSSISASVTMSAGSHTVIVRAWDSTGAFGDQTLTLNVVNPGVTVTVSSPSPGATVTSPVTINASATSAHPITGWHIYVDSVDSYSAVNVSSISASVAMSVGAHTIVVRAWDSTGAYNSQTFTLNVVNPGVTVTVSSPAPGATVNSPVTINASATSSHTITGWHIYVDSVDSYSATNVSSISASLTMSVGAHTIVVRAWDSTGAYGDQTFTLTVVAAGVEVTVSSPSNNATVTSPATINASATSSHPITGWHIYVDSVDSYSVNNVSSISASLTMSVGTHTVIVRAWDSTGAFGDQTLTLTVASAGVTVTVSSPSPGATVSSPVTINASASSSHPITGWHIYVDSVDSYSVNNVSSISASVTMSVGTHTVIVRAWDSTGAYGDQTFTLNVVGAGVTVTVSSPANNATVSSPVTINASAASSHPITGWHIYVDGVDSFSQNNVSSISASVAMSAGTHTVIVRAWDSTGAYGDQTLTLTVQ